MLTSDKLTSQLVYRAHVFVQEQFNHLPLFEGDIHKAPPTVDPKTRIDCGKVTNAELGTFH